MNNLVNAAVISEICAVEVDDCSTFVIVGRCLIFFI